MYMLPQIWDKCYRKRTKNTHLVLLPLLQQSKKAPMNFPGGDLRALSPPGNSRVLCPPGMLPLLPQGMLFHHRGYCCKRVLASNNTSKY